MSYDSDDFRITRGLVHGQCQKCQQPFLGEFDADNELVVLKCVNCSNVGYYKYVWPDDLPRFDLRKVRKPRRSPDDSTRGEK